MASLPFINLSYPSRMLQQNYEGLTPTKKFQLIVRKVILLFSIEISKSEGSRVQGKILEDDYWLEFFDPKHRRLSIIYPHYKTWLKMDRRISFWEYLADRETFDESLRAYSIEYFKEERLQKHFISKIVLTAKGCIFYKQNKVLKDRKYIFVIGPDAKLYVAVKRKGLLQHSSFFQGKSVLLAGFLVIQNGVLAGWNNSSGHYKHDVKALNLMVAYIKLHAENSEQTPCVYLEKLN